MDGLLSLGLRPWMLLLDLTSISGFFINIENLASFIYSLSASHPLPHSSHLFRIKICLCLYIHFILFYSHLILFHSLFSISHSLFTQHKALELFNISMKFISTHQTIFCSHSKIPTWFTCFGLLFEIKFSSNLFSKSQKDVMTHIS